MAATLDLRHRHQTLVALVYSLIRQTIHNGVFAISMALEDVVWPGDVAAVAAAAVGVDGALPGLPDVVVLLLVAQVELTEAVAILTHFRRHFLATKLILFSRTLLLRSSTVRNPPPSPSYCGGMTVILLPIQKKGKEGKKPTTDVTD